MVEAHNAANRAHVLAVRQLSHEDGHDGKRAAGGATDDVVHALVWRRSRPQKHVQPLPGQPAQLCVGLLQQPAMRLVKVSACPHGVFGNDLTAVSSIGRKCVAAHETVLSTHLMQSARKPACAFSMAPLCFRPVIAVISS